MTPEQVADARQHIKNWDDERMADSLRLALTEIERLRELLRGLTAPFECESCGHSELSCAGCGAL